VCDKDKTIGRNKNRNVNFSGSTGQHAVARRLPGEEGPPDRLREDGERERIEGRRVREVCRHRRNDRHPQRNRSSTSSPRSPHPFMHIGPAHNYRNSHHARLVTS